MVGLAGLHPAAGQRPAAEAGFLSALDQQQSAGAIVHDRADTADGFFTFGHQFSMYTRLAYVSLSDSQHGLACGRNRSGKPGQPVTFSSIGWWFPMNLKKIVGFLVVIFVLFWIISQPSNASGSVNGLMGNLREAGNSMATFISNVL
ncbi:MAG TPA: hypothetical protein VGM60_08725 [Pseudonocardia sp.]|uniref:hypothetical protein n=1 Tax=Pseudonocardia sp. TaxID=60912 RepID=UPI002F419B7D